MSKNEKAATKPAIPGLPEEDRMKGLKLKRKKKTGKKKKSTDDEETRSLTRNDFLISPESGLMKGNPKPEEFHFSDDATEDGDTDSDTDDFEDSKETVSDTDNTPTGDFPTAFNIKAKSSVKPSPKTQPKRAAASPVESKEVKKSRANQQSNLLKKK